MNSLLVTIIVCLLLQTTTIAFRSSLFRRVPPPRHQQWAHNEMSQLLVERIKEEPQNQTAISTLIASLEQEGLPTDISQDDSTRFEPLLGLYQVSHVQTLIASENPVGGKWTRKNGWAQRVFQSRRSFQHLLPVDNTTTTRLVNNSRNGMNTAVPVVAQAINVISLQAFCLRLSVILRGDCIALSESDQRDPLYCQALSPLAVRVLFDAPRIVVGRFCHLYVGPQTSVTLDTPNYDATVRLGLGGRSGTRFVFEPCLANDAEANEFQTLLLQKPWSKTRTVSGLVGTALAGLLWGVLRGKSTVPRLVGASVSLLASLAAALIAFSGGGIEAGDRSVDEAKQLLPTAKP